MSRFLVAMMLGTLVAGGCAGLPPPNEADALRASVQFPGTTVAALVRGRQLYIDHCSGCHTLVRPQAKPPQAWPKVVREMTERSKLSEATAAEITRYLMVASSAPR